ncbi:hypothetical protein HK096_003264, partial [Nowakowskiella sp. JEL0078]
MWNLFGGSKSQEPTASASPKVVAGDAGDSGSEEEIVETIQVPMVTGFGVIFDTRRVVRKVSKKKRSAPKAEAAPTSPSLKKPSETKSNRDDFFEIKSANASAPNLYYAGNDSSDRLFTPTENKRMDFAEERVGRGGTKTGNNTAPTPVEINPLALTRSTSLRNKSKTRNRQHADDLPPKSTTLGRSLPSQVEE